MFDPHPQHRQQNSPSGSLLWIADLMGFIQMLSFRKHPDLGSRFYLSAKLILKHSPFSFPLFQIIQTGCRNLIYLLLLVPAFKINWLHTRSGFFFFFSDLINKEKKICRLSLALDSLFTEQGVVPSISRTISKWNRLEQIFCLLCHSFRSLCCSRCQSQSHTVQVGLQSVILSCIFYSLIDPKASGVFEGSHESSLSSRAESSLKTTPCMTPSNIVSVVQFLQILQLNTKKGIKKSFVFHLHIHIYVYTNRLCRPTVNKHVQPGNMQSRPQVKLSSLTILPYLKGYERNTTL